MKPEGFLHARKMSPEYIYLKCPKCNDRVKIARDKGSYWIDYDFLPDFLLQHKSCGVTKLILEFE